MESGILLLRPEKSEAQPPILTSLQSKHSLQEKTLQGKLVGSLFIIRDRDRRYFLPLGVFNHFLSIMGVDEGRIADVFIY